MGDPAVSMDVRQVGDSMAIVDIKGDVTAACEPVLMSAYEAGERRRRGRGCCSTSPASST